ncbi:MAG: cytochrome bd-I oxidase subunit CydX [Rhodocyclaceae bacterium]|nr:cytochrome bd-I oxidase subunit CydX [Rhodocyclaceae bacterium]
MWYFAWILGIGFAVLLAILNAMWGELEGDRLRAADTRHGDYDEFRH